MLTVQTEYDSFFYAHMSRT